MPHRRPLVSLAFATAFAASFAPGAARAQALPSVDATTWHPSTDPRAGLVLEPVTTAGAWQWNVAAWFNYAQAPVVLRDSVSNGVAIQPLAHVLAADLTVGLGLGDRVAIGVDVPVYLYQDGSSSLPAAILSTGTPPVPLGSVPTSGIGDVAILGKATLVTNDHQGLPVGFGLAALGGITVPTGDATSFHGDGTTKVSLSLLGEYALGPGSARASLGYTLRTADVTWDSGVSGVPGGLTFGDMLPWSAGFALRPKAVLPSLDGDDRQAWEIAVHGWLPVNPVGPFAGTGASALSPAMLAIDDRVQLGHYHDAFVLAGVDLGLDQAVGVPSFRGGNTLGSNASARMYRWARESSRTVT